MWAQVVKRAAGCICPRAQVGPLCASLLMCSLQFHLYLVLCPHWVPHTVCTQSRHWGRMWGRCCGMVRLSMRAGPAHPCRQIQLLLLRLESYLWSWGNWRLGTYSADWTDTVLSSPPWECWLGQGREGTVRHRGGPTGTHEGPISGTLPCYLLVPGTQHC